MTVLVANVTGDDVGLFLGRDDIAFTQGPAQVAADLARDMASAYTRGRGFENPLQIPRALKSVIIARAVRLLGNVQQLLSENRDGVAVNYGAAGQGFTYQESLVLDDFRKKAAAI